jgi:predicted  nucleic acid-binding Zn ribbon protein
MMKNRFLLIQKSERLQLLSWLVLLTLSLFAVACSHEGTSVKPLGLYEAGSKTQDDVENLLKADARVQDYETNGATLSVNVNDRFTAQPYGLQQRALGQWYNVWQAANSGSKTAAVIAQSNGEEIARWTASDGYKPKVKPKEKEPAE